MLKDGKINLSVWERLFLEGFKISREGANAECLVEDHLGHKDFYPGMNDKEIWVIIKPYYDFFLKENYRELNNKEVIVRTYPSGIYWEEILRYGKPNGEWLYIERMYTLGGWNWVYGGIDYTDHQYIPWVELPDAEKTTKYFPSEIDVEVAKSVVEKNFVDRKRKYD